MSPRSPLAAPARLLPLVAAVLLGGCEGAGEGQVSGALFLRGCEGLGEAAAPAPFQLDPEYFSADTIRPAPFGTSGSAIDPRIPSRVELRLQRSSHRSQFTDSFMLYLTGVEALRERLGQPFPITAVALDGTATPLPAQEPPYVRAAVELHGTCPITNLQPQLRGTITLRELGFEPGEVGSPGTELEFAL